MGKKQREERKGSIQEARRPSLGSGSATLASRPTAPMTIEQIVENGPDGGGGLEQHLPDVPASLTAQEGTTYFGNICVDTEDGVVVATPAPGKKEPILEDVYLGEGGPSNGSTSPSVEYESTIAKEDVDRRKARRWAYKNVYGLSVAYVALFTAFIGLQNLQSSINSAGGLGLVTLSLLYAMFIGAGFITPGFLKLFGTKYSLLFGFVCHLIYTLSNYYPSWYTLVPGSILIGFASAPIWAAASTHLAEVAVTVAPSLRKKQDYLISKFTGLFFFFFQFSQVPGNLASSLILFPYSHTSSSDDVYSLTDFNSSNNYTISAGEEGVCGSVETGDFDVKFLYVLVSVYVGFIVTSIIILLVFVDRLPTNNSFFSTEKKFELYLKTPLVELFSVLRDVKMLLIAPMVVYNGMELAFAFGSFTEYYISQCFGTYQVGFTLIVLGLSSSVMSVVYSRLLKYLPRFLIVMFGVCLSSAMLLFMLLWERAPSYAAIFAISAGWGAADAVWTTMPTSITGILFASRSDVAYSAMRIWQALGFTVGFAMAEFLPFHGRVWVLLATVLLAAVVNLILEFTTQSREDLLLCLYYKQRHKTRDNVESGGDLSEETTSTGSFPSAGSEQGGMAAVDELTKDNNTIGQNPIFIMYQGRRPSTMSTYSADSLDGLMPSLTGGEGLPVVHANGQNPLFMMHQGRRPSAVSTCSADSLDGVLPSVSSTSDGPVVLTHYSRRSSTDCHNVMDELNGEPSLSDQISLRSSNSNSKENRYPPVAMTTFPYLDSGDRVRALSPIREFENEEEHPPINDSPRKISIQRSDSYMEALNSTLASLEQADSKIKS